MSKYIEALQGEFLGDDVGGKSWHQWANGYVFGSSHPTRWWGFTPIPSTNISNSRRRSHIPKPGELPWDSHGDRIDRTLLSQKVKVMLSTLFLALHLNEAPKCLKIASNWYED